MKKTLTLIAVLIATVGSLGILRARQKGNPQSAGLMSDHVEHHHASPSRNSQGEELPPTVHQESNNVQAIEGRVLDRRGNPVEAVDVIAVRSPKGLLLTAKTNKEGYFSIKGLRAGMYEVFTKEENGPTCPSCLFYSGGLPTEYVATVSLVEGQGTANIVLQAAPKLAKLTGKIIDAETGEPLVASRITFRRTDNPDYYLETGPDEDGNFVIPLPLVPVTVEVVSPGYGSWHYVRDDLPPVLMRVDSLKLNRGESRKLEVRLRRKAS